MAVIPAKGKKQLQVDKDKTTIFATVAVAAVVLVFSLMVSKGLYSQAEYFRKVAGKKEEAVKQLEANKEAVSSLMTSYEEFTSQSPNMLGGAIEGPGQRDGDNGSLVLDALPNKYDFPALTSSIERLLSGYSIQGITGIDENITQENVETPTPVEMPFGVEVVTNYDGFRDLISSFDRSIRPLQIVSMEISGSNDNLQANIQARTYYQAERGLQVTEETIQ